MESPTRSTTSSARTARPTPDRRRRRTSRPHRVDSSLRMRGMINRREIVSSGSLVGLLYLLMDEAIR